MVQPTQSSPGQSGAVPKFLSRVPRPWFKQALPEEPRLPAVVSVTVDSLKGTAVVVLRDHVLIERCALQRVAIVDGICVEFRRHSKRSPAEGEEEKQGICVAWGARAARRVTVTVEGLETYFNSLVGKTFPQGLWPKPPFQECGISFPLKSDGGAEMNENLQVTGEVDAALDEKMLESNYCQMPFVKQLLTAQGRLDDLAKRPPPPMARSLMTRVAFSQLFPHSAEAASKHENRAADIVAELSSFVGLLDGIPQGCAFLDLYGGRGEWSKHLCKNTEMKLRGFGFSPKAVSCDDADGRAEEKDDWYRELYEHSEWKAFWGVDGTGDLLEPGNIEHVAKALASEPVMLCVADGGLSDEAVSVDQSELYFYRLFQSELLMAASCLKPGGRFVCKLYTTFSTSTAALLYLTTRLFDTVSIIKPMSSRVTGSERYLTAFGFRESSSTNAIRAALMQSHARGNGSIPLVTPLLTPLVAAECLLLDRTFTTAMHDMATGLCQRQASALDAVVDRAIFLEDMAMPKATPPETCIVGSPATKRKERENLPEKRKSVCKTTSEAPSLGGA